MFGMSFEKLIVLGVIAVMILGPERLPGYAARLGAFARAMTGLVESAKERMHNEMGPEFDDIDWKKLDPRQYDPRRIVREALWADTPSGSTVDQPAGPRQSSASRAETGAADPLDPLTTP